VTITATPQADPSKKAQATLSIVPGINVSVSPAAPALAANHRVTLTAQVNGTSPAHGEFSNEAAEGTRSENTVTHFGSETKP